MSDKPVTGLSRLLPYAISVALLLLLLAACAQESSTPTPTPRPASQGVHTPEDMRAQYDRWPDEYKFAVSDDVVVLLAYPMDTGYWGWFALVLDIPTGSAVTLNWPANLLPGPGAAPVPLFQEWDKLFVGSKELRALRRYNSEEAEARLEAVLSDQTVMARILAMSRQNAEGGDFPAQGPTPTPTLQEAVTIDGVNYRAETRLEKSSPTADVAPVMLRPWLTISNQSDSLREVRLEGCNVRLRLYSDASRSDLAWDHQRRLEQAGGTCGQKPYTVSLAPGESYEKARALRASNVLNDGLQPGHYYFSVVIMANGRRFELAAGDGDVTYGLEDLTFTAETQVSAVSPQKVAIIVTVTNPSQKRVRIEYGDCAVALVAYRTADRSGEPMWNGRKQSRVCLLYLATEELAPGESASPEEFRTAVPVRDILGDQEPEGRYHFAASIDVNGATLEVPAGEAELVR